MKPELIDYLSYRRPARSWAEEAFIEMLVMPLSDQADECIVDSFGNIAMRVGSPRIAWSCHTDTAGRGEPDFRRPAITAGGYGSPDGDVLGADDGTGAWLMAAMMRRKVEGLYLFHRDEEIGGLGSSHIADCAGESGLLEETDIAIALDRRGYSDVITHQAGGRCCSGEFAMALASLLNSASSKLSYEPSCEGIFTDTANYTRLVKECTNVSVGYFFEHTSQEVQDPLFASELAGALCSLDFSQLPVARDPVADEGGFESWDEEFEIDFAEHFGLVRLSDFAGERQ